ncbi:hypothetical protein GCM10009123_07640 [Kangiella japonica]|uniref:SatD family (SatD) n=1 Tax=Kangiella japonica TaxID=647384 RepID=A0ABN0SVU8_9GAMM
MSQRSKIESKKSPQVAVITGDIINSQAIESKVDWYSELQSRLSRFGNSPKDWQLYRGDSFQLVSYQPEKALQIALTLKAALKQYKELDVRMAIGIGSIEHHRDQVLQSSGEAFVNSGRKFDSLKKQTLALKTPWKEFDETISLLINLALLTIDHWAETSAEVVLARLEHPETTQKDIAALLSIPQSRVSERLSRAGYGPIMDAERYYRQTISEKLLARDCCPETNKKQLMNNS